LEWPWWWYLCNGGALILQESTITGNTANAGGGVAAISTRAVTITGTVISHNNATETYYAYSSGGGLKFSDVGSLAIANSTIAYNATVSSGGGVAVEQNLSLPIAVRITNTQIISNSAEMSGGGINVQQYYNVSASPLTMTLTDSSVLSNTAVYGGGGIDFAGDSTTGAATLTLQNSTVAGNQANGKEVIAPSGGGISFSGHGGLSIFNSAITNNSVSHNIAGGNSPGGGINFTGDGAGQLRIENSVIESNVAQTGGGLNGFVGPGSYLTNTIIRANQAIAGSSNQSGFGGGINGSDELRLSNVTLSGNTATADGGGAYGYGEIADSQIVNNTAGGNGGGLAGYGTLLRSTVAGNHAANGGGLSIPNSPTGRIEIVASTISANTAITDGGGIYVPWASFGGPIVTVRNSTLSGNSAGRQGGAFSDIGGISSSGRFISKAHFLNTSVISNTASLGSGGGLYHAGHIGGEDGPQELTLENVLLSGNTGGNCGGAVSADGFISYGHNLSSDASCPALTGPGDLKKIAAKIGPLQNNGGSTQTHALLDGSPAIDAGGAANCPATDQRGISRPQGAACDIGAYERQATTPYLHVAPAA
jgi:hypothetical protein